MEDCLFCQIAKGDIPSDIVYQDAQVVAFRDIHPQAPVHILVIPRQHIASVNDITEANSDLIAHIFTIIPHIAQEAGLSHGYRVISNCGRDACQSVRHLHFHLLGGAPLADRMA